MMATTKKSSATPLKVLGRSHYACSRCKNSKIKCSGDKPACSNCVNAGKQSICEYPNKDRKVIILESQLNNLQARIDQLENKLSSEENPNSDITIQQSSKRQKLENGISSSTVIKQNKDSGVKVEEFDFSDPPQPEIPQTISTKNSKSKIKNITKTDKHGATTCQVFDHELQSFLVDVSNNNKKKRSLLNSTSSSNGIEEEDHEDYLFDESDKYVYERKILSSTNYELPNKDYAVHLLNKVVRQYGSEFYLVDKESFFEMVDNIYESNSKITTLSLSYFFSVLAFGEQLYGSHTESIPGIEFFLLAMQLFNINNEELSLDFIQCSLTIAMFCVNLNRASTAYSYFGIAMRSAVSKGLHRQENNMKNYIDKSIANDEEKFKIFKEKAKRVWWSIFTIDAFWSTKMSLPVHIQICDTDIEYPLENFVDLNDGFDMSILQENVNLAKFVSKLVKKLYCPQNRTYYFTSSIDVASIKTSKGLFLKSTLECLVDLTEYFEKKLPPEYLDKRNIIQKDNRRFANLFLRFNQLILITTRPLILSIFKKKMKETDETKKATNACIFSACCNIDVIYNLKKNGMIFSCGFWDCQYVFSALLILIIGSLTGRKYAQLNRGIKLIKFMEASGNINAKNNFNRLKELDVTLRNMSGSKFSLHLDDFAHEKKPKDFSSEPTIKPLMERRKSVDSVSPTSTEPSSVKLEDTINNMTPTGPLRYESNANIPSGYNSSTTQDMSPPTYIRPNINDINGMLNPEPQVQFQNEFLFSQSEENAFGADKNQFLSMEAWNELHNYEDIHFTPQANLNISNHSLNSLVGNIQTWDYLGIPQMNECGIGAIPIFNENELNFGNPAA